MKFILADTSVWIHHFRDGNDTLAELLETNQVAIHPFVIGELACGNLRNRLETLRLLEILPRTTVAGHFEALDYLELHRLSGKGVGWIDVHLLASCALSEAELWTRDLRLRKLAMDLEIGFKP